jgi:hypothetical protein
MKESNCIAPDSYLWSHDLAWVMSMTSGTIQREKNISTRSCKISPSLTLNEAALIIVHRAIGMHVSFYQWAKLLLRAITAAAVRRGVPTANAS